jgi:putative aminopeptidase FrvX
MTDTGTDRVRCVEGLAAVGLQRLWILAVLLAGSLAATPLAAQTAERATDSLTIRLAAMTAVSGLEQAMVDSLLGLLPAARRDRAGNAVLVLGSGSPRRLAACAIDEPGYVVGGIRGDGYLMLRRVGRPATPFFDQYLEGQRVTVFGRRGAVEGVIGVRSVHLTRGRTTSDDVFTVDQAFVDIGAPTRAAAEALGVHVLAPVAGAKRPHRYGADLLAAPSAARRAGCAALLAAVRGPHGAGAAQARGTVVVVFAVEGTSARGLLAAGRLHGPFVEALLLGTATAGEVRPPAELLAAAGIAGAAWVVPNAAYLGTPVETVRLAEVDSLAGGLRLWMEGRP